MNTLQLQYDHRNRKSFDLCFVIKTTLQTFELVRNKK